MTINPFKSKTSILQPNSLRVNSSNPRQKSKIRNPFERKILIPQNNNHSNKKQIKSKSLYGQSGSQRSYGSDKQNQLSYLNSSMGRKYFNHYSTISILEEGFRKQKIIELQRKYSQVFGFQTLRYQYDGDHKNKQYFNQKQTTNKQIKKNKIFSQSCSTYSQLGAKIRKQNCSKNQNRQKNKLNHSKSKAKKMLSWNIENQRQQTEQKRRNSQKQFSSNDYNNHNPTFGIIEQVKIDNRNKFIKKNSIQKINLQKQAIEYNLQQDYVVQFTNSYRLQNKLSSSSSSFFSRQNSNNLKYSSNFQGVMLKKPQENYNKMYQKGKQDKINGDYPQSIQYLGKKFDLIAL